MVVVDIISVDVDTPLSEISFEFDCPITPHGNVIKNNKKQYGNKRKLR